MRRAADTTNRSQVDKWGDGPFAPASGDRAGSVEASGRRIVRFAVGSSERSRRSGAQVLRRSDRAVLAQVAEGGKARARSATTKA